jgi:hypothetical protein
MKYIRDTYHVPAKRGMRVEANGHLGRIVGAPGGYLKIKIDMHKKPELYHPTWHMIYFTDDDTITFMGERKI